MLLYKKPFLTVSTRQLVGLNSFYLPALGFSPPFLNMKFINVHITSNTISSGSRVQRKQLKQCVFYYMPRLSRKGEAHVSVKYDRIQIICGYFAPF